MGLKCLVYRWWLMHPAGYRFKIMNGKSKRIATSIPAHYVKRMRSIMETIQYSFLFCFDQEISLFIKRRKIQWRTNISFAIRRMLQQLAIFTYIFFGIPDRTK